MPPLIDLNLAPPTSNLAYGRSMFSNSKRRNDSFNQHNHRPAGVENPFNTTKASCNATGCSGAVVSTFNARDFLRIRSPLNSRPIQVVGRLRF